MLTEDVRDAGSFLLLDLLKEVGGVDVVKVAGIGACDKTACNEELVTEQLVARACVETRDDSCCGC
jgi:hypothetical protein